MKFINTLVGILIIWFFLIGPALLVLMLGYEAFADTGYKATIKSIDDVTKTLTVSYTDETGDNTKNVKYDKNIYTVGQVITVYSGSFLSQGLVLDKHYNYIFGSIMLFIGILFFFAIFLVTKYIILL